MRRVDGAGFYDVRTGKRFQNAQEAEWPGMRAAFAEVGNGDDQPPDCRIGLLLDLEVGSLAVYKNDIRLGPLVDGQWSDHGRLQGEYSWALSTRRLGACVYPKHLQIVGRRTLFLRWLASITRI